MKKAIFVTAVSCLFLLPAGCLDTLTTVGSLAAAGNFVKSLLALVNLPTA